MVQGESKGVKHLAPMSTKEGHGRLKASIWSSETLVAGCRAVSRQPHDLLVKTEDVGDEELAREVAVS